MSFSTHQARFLCMSLGAILALCLCGPAWAQKAALADHFGFDGLDVIKIGRGAGPVVIDDMNGDGLNDLIVVNNFTSRIELHLQKRGVIGESDSDGTLDVNEFPEHWRYRRQTIPVTHRVAAVIGHDFDDDGLRDLIYAGAPSEIVFMRQSAPGVYVMGRRHRVRELTANRNSFTVADVLGDDRPELLAMVSGDVKIWTLDGDDLGEPITLSAGDNLAAFLLEDFNGDGLTDIAGVILDDAAPTRLWLATLEDGAKALGAQLRFEQPPLREAESVRLHGQAAARLAAIERASKRIVIYELSPSTITSSGNRDAALWSYSFTDPKNRTRDHAVTDVDGDGLLDFIATDTEANAVVVYQQVAGKGLIAGQRHPSLSELDRVVAANVDDDPYAEVFVLSEAEGVVGRSDLGPHGHLDFPSPLSISDGFSPVAMDLVRLDSGPRLAVIAKSSRDHVIDLLDPAGGRETIELGKLSRSPQTILAIDADQNGRTDLLLFTRDKPMTMLYASDDGFKLTESDEMGQFGLVKAATADNTAVFDIDGDGREELLIADNNYVRAVRYEPNPEAGVGAGWQVVAQINAADSSSKLVSITLLPDRIIAADKQNSRLVFMGKDPDDEHLWHETESVNVRGFGFNVIHAGAFAGDGQENILAVGDSGFAVVRLAGERFDLKETASWRTSHENRLQHELAVGDINGDGLTDMVSLDAGEQMCELFSFTELGRMIYAVGFQVFESKIFSGGDTREFQPSEVHIGDVTGDGADDLILLAHDRVLIYPQMMRGDR